MSQQHIMDTSAERVLIFVLPERGGCAWRLKVGGLSLPERTQAAAVLHARALAHDHARGGGRAEVVIYGRTGRIRSRDTYPRASDPRCSKG